MQRHATIRRLAATALLSLLLAAPLAGAVPPKGMLEWHEHLIDPDDPNREVPKEYLIGGYAKGEVGYYLLQFRGPVGRKDKAAVERAGAALLDYVPGFGFIAAMDAAALSRLRGLPQVRWVGIYQPGYRLGRALRGGRIDTLWPYARRTPWPLEGSLAPPGAPRGPADDPPLALGVTWFDGVSAQQARAAVGDLGGTVHQVARASRGPVVLIALPASRLLRLAHTSGVKWIEPYAPPEPQNNRVRRVVGADHGIDIPQTLTGLDEVIAIADTGVDTGEIFGLHPDLANVSELISYPVQDIFLLFVQNVGDDDGPADLGSGHGTHVTGIALGRGASGEPKLRGIAPEARFVLQAMEQWTEFMFVQPRHILHVPPVGTLLQDAYDAGARIHSNSWGSNANLGGYSFAAYHVDDFVWEHQDMLVLFAAGNFGQDADGDGLVEPGSVSPQATAKNAVAVGASENDRPELAQTYPLPASAVLDRDSMTDEVRGLAAFSSRGPVSGAGEAAGPGRIKPDLVAPGTLVLSARSSLPERVVHFGDDLEGDVEKWAPDGGWALTSATAHSGVWSWHDSPGGDYAPGTVSTVATPTMDLSDGPRGGRALQFWVRFDLGAGDFWAVDLSVNDGVWTPLIEHQFTGAQPQWELYTIGLGGADGVSDARFRFRLESDLDASTGDGLYVDDVRVASGAFGSALPGDFDPAFAWQDDRYMFLSGTSMATPVVAGAAALVRQHLREEAGVTTPSAALVRAVLMNGAVDISPGQYADSGLIEVEPAPDNGQGWGLLNVQRALGLAGGAALSVYDGAQGPATGERERFKLEIEDTGHPVVVTMAYHDFPGAGLANDLDLSLVAPDGRVYHPNGGTGPDRANNVERIVVPSSEVITGTWTVLVDGYNVPWEIQLIAGGQPYALAILAPGWLATPAP